MSEWKEYKFGEIYDFASGLSKSRSEFGFGFPFLSFKEVFNNYFLPNQLQEFVNANEKERDLCSIHKGDVFLTRTSETDEELGMSSVALKNYPNATFNGFTKRLRPKEDHPISPEYAGYFYRSPRFRATISSMASSTTRASLNNGMMERLSIIAPPLPEQRAIASVLSSLDGKIDLLNRQNKTLEAMAETLFRQWFVEEAEEGWKTIKLCDYIRTNIASIDKLYLIKNIRYLDTGSLTEGKIASYQNFDIKDAPSRARRIVKHNDVLISTVRPNQKHYGILKHPEEDIIVSTGFCVVTCEQINPHFVYVFLTTNEMTEYLHTIAEGSTSTYPSLKPSDIEMLEFQLPPQEKLDDFAKYADNAWEKIDYNHKQIRILEKMRDGLLPKLMSDEVKVSH